MLSSRRRNSVSLCVAGLGKIKEGSYWQTCQLFRIYARKSFLLFQYSLKLFQHWIHISSNCFSIEFSFLQSPSLPPLQPLPRADNSFHNYLSPRDERASMQQQIPSLCQISEQDETWQQRIKGVADWLIRGSSSSFPSHIHPFASSSSRSPISTSSNCWQSCQYHPGESPLMVVLIATSRKNVPVVAQQEGRCDVLRWQIGGNDERFGFRKSSCSWWRW